MGSIYSLITIIDDSVRKLPLNFQQFLQFLIYSNFEALNSGFSEYKQLRNIGI